MDLDDTILAYDMVAKKIWLEVCTEFAEQIGDFTPRQLASSIDAYRRWHWSDPERPRKSRLHLPLVPRSGVEALCSVVPARP